MFPKLSVSTQLSIGTRRLLAAAACLSAASATAAPTPQILAPVFSDGFNDWFSAAQTSQADAFLIGDSTVLTSGGWAYALNGGLARSSKFGLAGSGLLSGLNNNEGEGGGYFQIARNNDFGDAPPATGFRDTDQTFNWDYYLPPTNAGQTLGDAGTGPVSPFGSARVNGNNTFGPASRGVEIDGVGISSGGPLTFTVDLANAGSGDATFRVGRRTLDTGGNEVVSFLAAPGGGDVFTLAGNAGFDSQSFSFAADPAYSGPASFTIQSQSVGLEVGSFRVRNTAATGVTVSSWGYGGQPTDDFLNEQYLPLTEDFRQRTLNQIVDGGSGELLVILTEGFNDLSAGDTPEQFVTNIQALQAAITADFVAAGNDADQLSFLAFGQYYTGLADPYDDNVSAYSLALRDAAVVDDSLSFLDLRQLTAGEDLNTIVGRLDNTRLHFGNEGFAAFYGDALVAAVPEPASALLLGVGGLMLTRRRRA